MSLLLDQLIDGVPIVAVGGSIMRDYPPKFAPLEKKRTRAKGGGRKPLTPAQRKATVLRLLKEGPGAKERRWLNRLMKLRTDMETRGEDVSFLPPRWTHGFKSAVLDMHTKLAEDR